MKIERIKNTSRNMVYGTALQLLKLAVPFFMRTVMIYLLGVEYLGLNSLFTSVLSVLNLAELGVGSAMVYSMYKPIAEDDGDKICALMGLYKKYYRIIGIVILILGMLLLPFIPELINGDVPADMNVYVLYLLNLLAAVFSYWLFAYKGSILQAHQRNDVVSKVTLATDSIKYLLQLLVLITTKNYYLYVIVILLTQMLNNVATAYFAEKMYPQYRAAGQLSRQEQKIINCRIRDLFTAKLGTVIVYSSDTIVISAFLGLRILAVYQNYYYLFTAVTALVTIIFTSVRAGLGNSIIVDDQEKVFEDFKKFLLIIVWIAGFCSTCFLCLYQPFMELWVGSGLLMEFGVVVCLVIYFFVHCLNIFLNSYKDASGIWHEDRFRPLVEAVTNLILNIVLVNVIGLYGIVLSTIFSMLLVAPWLIHNLFKMIFGRKHIREFLVRLAYYAAITFLAAALTYRVCGFITGNLIYVVSVRLAVCVVFTNVLLLIFYFKIPEFKQCVILADHVTKQRLFFIHKLAVRYKQEDQYVH